MNTLANKIEELTVSLKISAFIAYGFVWAVIFNVAS